MSRQASNNAKAMQQLHVRDCKDQPQQAMSQLATSIHPPWLSDTSAALQHKAPRDISSHRRCLAPARLFKGCDNTPAYQQPHCNAACVYPNKKQAPQHYSKCCGTSMRHACHSIMYAHSNQPDMLSNSVYVRDTSSAVNTTWFKPIKKLASQLLRSLLEMHWPDALRSFSP
jgi:hypothetical protein